MHAFYLGCVSVGHTKALAHASGFEPGPRVALGLLASQTNVQEPGTLFAPRPHLKLPGSFQDRLQGPNGNQRTPQDGPRQPPEAVEILVNRAAIRDIQISVNRWCS